MTGGARPSASAGRRAAGVAAGPRWVGPRALAGLLRAWLGRAKERRGGGGRAETATGPKRKEEGVV
jgi:hypothetical protein